MAVLAGMNTELAGAALSARHRRLDVLDGGEEVTDELVRDMIEVLTSCCARRCGRRSAPNGAGKALRRAAWDAGLAGPGVAG